MKRNHSADCKTLKRDGSGCTCGFLDQFRAPVNDPATSQQDKPHGSGPDIADLVCKDIMARKAEGAKKYGEPLRAFNGRSALVDAYQESLDQSHYLRQAIEEEAQGGWREKAQALANTYGHALIVIGTLRNFVKTAAAMGWDKFDGCIYCARHRSRGHLQSCPLMEAEKQLATMESSEA